MIEFAKKQKMQYKFKLPIENLSFVKILAPEPFKLKTKRAYKNGAEGKWYTWRKTNLEIPTMEGIYLLYDKYKNLLYVGETKCLAHRLGHHCLDNPEVVYAKFFQTNCSKRERLVMEQILILKLKPLLQKDLNKIEYGI